MTKQWQIKNRKFLQKDLFDAIQKQVDSEIKPKIAAQGKKTLPDEEIVAKYEFRDLKSDLEDMKEFFVTDYPTDLVFQKIFEVTFELSERLHMVTKQSIVSAEMFASESLKRLQ